ncbi:hypothetical protein E4T45_14980 [Aureobasidium sp. EXF-8846]|nr:hypothetical protein E4T45_14980 [Aureobasidium sp. EXF-8846]
MSPILLPSWTHLLLLSNIGQYYLAASRRSGIFFPGDIVPDDVIRLFSPRPQTVDLVCESNHAFHNAGNDAFYNMHVLLMLALQPGLLREPEYGSSIAGVLLSGRSRAWQLVRRLIGSQTKETNSMTPGSLVKRPEGVASVQPPQDAGSSKLTLGTTRPKT